MTIQRELLDALLKEDETPQDILGGGSDRGACLVVTPRWRAGKRRDDSEVCDCRPGLCGGDRASQGQDWRHGGYHPVRVAGDEHLSL